MDKEDNIKADAKARIPVRVNSKGAVRPRVYNIASMNVYTAPETKQPRYETEETKEPMHFEHLVQQDEKENLDKEDILKAMTETFQAIGAFIQEDEEEDLVVSDCIDDDENLSSDEKETDFEPMECEENHSKFEGNKLEDQMPIYSGHSMSIHTSLILIFVYSMIHSVTGIQLSDLLTLLSAHFLHANPVYSSLKRFKLYFASLKSPLVKHFFCTKCLIKVEIEDKLCPNVNCVQSFKDTKNKSYFIEFPVQSQLEAFFLRPKFLNDLKYKLNRKKINQDGLEDIYDGEIYKKMSEYGKPLSAEFPFNLSLTWNTDGIPLFKSSKISIWPMYLMINELPFKERIKKENMIFYGLWFGDVKPVTCTFFSPLHDTLCSLERKGIDVMVNGKIQNVKCFLICGTADLPARSTVMNMVQFNGAYSCSKCLQKGKTEKTSNRGHTHIFPFIETDPIGEKRKSEDCLLHATEATETTNSTFGIKGPSFLMGLSSYDYVKSTSIDYMHCVLLGITKRLMSLWFSPTFSKNSFSLTNHLRVVDERLSKIKPTYNITRRPRSIADHLKYWKASEMRAWLLFYSLPVLVDIMPPNLFFNYCAFVQAIWLMTKSSILPCDIDRSKILLYYFVYMMDTLYGARYLTINAHMLLHIPECVKDLGPLWVYSCFPFESLNGELLKLFHGTQAFDIQIVSAVNMHQILPKLLNTIPDEYKKISIVETYVNKGKIVLGIQLDHDVFAVGYRRNFNLDNTDYALLVSFLGKEPKHLDLYERIFLRNQVLHSSLYGRVTARNSYTVKYIHTVDRFQIHYGKIKYFLVHRDEICNCREVCVCKKQIIACINLLKDCGTFIPDSEDNPKYLGLTDNHIHKVLSSDVYEFVEIHSISCLSLCVNFNKDEQFVCEFPNIIESD